MEQVIEGINLEGGTYTLSWTGTATATVNGSAVANKGQVTLPANTNATVRFSGGTVGLIQLEAGSVATPFEHRPYGLELALCQRYYEAGNVFGQSPGAGTFGGVVVFKTTKRVIPTMALTLGTTSAITTNPSLSVGGNYTDAYGWNATTNASGGYCFFGWTASAEL
jgi:hypothetical protein